MHKNSAFTLIELSIVLVIIGLIVGGILLGNVLIRSAEQRKQIAQFEMYNLAVNSFMLKYGGYWPGDAPAASAYLTGATDGNGNGILQLANGSTGFTSGTYGGEYEQFFIQLSLANMVDKNFTGGGGLDTGYPRMQINSAMGMLAASTGSFNDDPYGLYFHMRVGQASTDLGAADDVVRLTSEDTMFMDVKIDDGLPLKGRFKAGQEAGFVAPVSPCNNGTSYYWNVSTSRCRPQYRLK